MIDLPTCRAFEVAVRGTNRRGAGLTPVPAFHCASPAPASGVLPSNAPHPADCERPFTVSNARFHPARRVIVRMTTFPTPFPFPPREVTIEARVAQIVFSHRHADLIMMDGSALPRQRFIIDGQTGRLFVPVPRRVISEGEATLCIPEERAGVELLCDLALAEDRADGAWIDRWSAYHGSPAGVMAVFMPQAAKLEGVVVDADEVDLRNPLVANEARLVRMLNADREALGRACRAALGAEVHDPLAVGIDAWGLDVRTRVGMVRVRVHDAPLSERTVETSLRSWVQAS